MFQPEYTPSLPSITPMQLCSAAIPANISIATPISATWISANRAIFVPFRINDAITITQLMVANGTVVSGNIDVGVYSANNTGADRLIISSGSTAQAGTSAVQLFNVTDTPIGAGDYYFAIAMDNATGTVYRSAPSFISCQRAGVLQQTSAFPLPAQATPTTLANGVFYMAGIWRF